MSLVLNGTTQCAWYNASVFSVAGTVAAWFKSTSDSAIQAIWGEGDHLTTYDYWRLGLRGDLEGDPVNCTIRRTGTAQANTSSGYSINNWHHALFVATNSQDHRVYIDGGSEGVDTDNDQTPVSVSRMGIGALPYNGGWANFFAGKLAEVTIWNTILTEAERLLLAAGVDPSVIQSSYIAGDWPLLTDENDDSVFSQNLTLVDTPSFDADDHPSIGVGIKSARKHYRGFLLQGQK